VAAPPPRPGAPGAYGPQVQPPGAGLGPPKPSGNATAALVLGIISIVLGCCCWPGGLVCSIIAIVLGNKAVNDIAVGIADPTSAGKARAGKVCGIVGLILSLLAVVITIINFASGGGVYPPRFRF